MDTPAQIALRKSIASHQAVRAAQLAEAARIAQQRAAQAALAQSTRAGTGEKRNG